jgi:hypothetical protein
LRNTTGYCKNSSQDPYNSYYNSWQSSTISVIIILLFFYNSRLGKFAM